MGKVNYAELAARLLCFVLIFGIVYVSIKYLLGYAMPFLLAWGIGCLVRPASRAVSARCHVPVRACAFFMVLLLLSIIISAAVLLVNALITEGGELVELLIGCGEAIADGLARISDAIASLSSSQTSGELARGLEGLIDGVTSELASRLGAYISSLATKLAVGLPDAIFVWIVAIMASFYFALDIDLVERWAQKLLPASAVKFLTALRGRVGRGFRRYMRAYLILYAITFSQLLIGFLVLGVEGSVLLAALIALVDMLPLIGTAAVLLPWGIVELLLGKYFLGFGLLILLGAMSILRQIAEPRIVGKSLGVHPLITLFAMYVGYVALGALGMIGAPIAVAVLLAGDG